MIAAFSVENDLVSETSANTFRPSARRNDDPVEITGAEIAPQFDRASRQWLECVHLLLHELAASLHEGVRVALDQALRQGYRSGLAMEQPLDEEPGQMRFKLMDLVGIEDVVFNVVQVHELALQQGGLEATARAEKL